MNTLDRTNLDGSRRSGKLVLWSLVALALFAARVSQVTSKTGDSAMLSANDRSRWCTVRALVENGTYQIDSIIRERDPSSGRRIWHTIDRVRHRGWDGREHDYSSKPPLFPTLLAGEYWLIHQCTGWTLASEPFLVVRWMVGLTNGLLLVAFWWAVARWIDRWCEHRWSAHLLAAMATFGTFLTTFAVTINNHLPAAVTAAWTLEALVLVARGDRRWSVFALGGIMAALTAANELPALSLLAASLIYLAWSDWKRWLSGTVPAVLLVAAAFFGTNYAAHGSWRPPYAHRGEGRVVAQWQRATLPSPRPGPVGSAWRTALKKEGIELSSVARWETTGHPNRWALFDRPSGRRWALRSRDSSWTLFEWDDWYDYAGSYWREGNRRGIDRGEPSALVYAWNVLIGHHGIFSLTPFWLLSLAGVWIWWRGGGSVERNVALLTAALSVVCLVFFLTRPQIDRNYGGMTSGFRWLFWLIPLWLAVSIPAVTACGRQRWKRGFAYGVLAVSVFSASFGANQPWSHPWLYWCGWGLETSAQSDDEAVPGGTSEDVDSSAGKRRLHGSA